jgi:simple sugar transport system ATP-binding protein
VTCVLGENGAGKSTLIKILSGAPRRSEDEYLVEGESVRFQSPAMPATTASRRSTRTWRRCR